MEETILDEMQTQGALMTLSLHEVYLFFDKVIGLWVVVAYLGKDWAREVTKGADIEQVYAAWQAEVGRMVKIKSIVEKGKQWQLKQTVYSKKSQSF